MLLHKNVICAPHTRALNNTICTAGWNNIAEVYGGHYSILTKDPSKHSALTAATQNLNVQSCPVSTHQAMQQNAYKCQLLFPLHVHQ